MSEAGDPLVPGRAEGTGETVGEAKWAALRELERRQPGLEKDSVRFQVVSEGERGLLGVGYAPARVIAEAPVASVVSPPPPPDEEPGSGGRQAPRAPRARLRRARPAGLRVGQRGRGAGRRPRSRARTSAS